MHALVFGKARVPARTLVAGAGGVFMWPGIALTERRGAASAALAPPGPQKLVQDRRCCEPRRTGPRGPGGCRHPFAHPLNRGCVGRLARAKTNSTGGGPMTLTNAGFIALPE